MAERELEPRVNEAVITLQAGAILTLTTDGMTDAEVMWVTPRALRAAALRLRAAVEARQPETMIILETYARNANNVDPVAEEFIADLHDIVALTEWAEAEGATSMTLEVNW